MARSKQQSSTLSLRPRARGAAAGASDERAAQARVDGSTVGCTDASDFELFGGTGSKPLCDNILFWFVDRYKRATAQEFGACLESCKPFSSATPPAPPSGSWYTRRQLADGQDCLASAHHVFTHNVPAAHAHGGSMSGN